MSAIENVSRRNVLKGGGVFVLAVALSSCGEQSASPVAAPPALSDALEPLNLFVSINEQGDVQILCHRAEMGQQARTGMARVVAEELNADWDRISVVQAEGSAEYGDQNTDGSTTIRADFTRLRRIGASARSMLERAAAETWGVPVSECSAGVHEIIHEVSGQRLGYGALAAAASAFEPPLYEGDGVDAETYRLKDPSEWMYIGKGASAVDLGDMMVGQAVYGQDFSLPGMKYAVIARSPVFRGNVEAFDDAAAMATPGVERVLQVPASAGGDGGFNPIAGVAVIANSTWAAKQGRDALDIQWSDGANSDYDSAAYRADLEAAVAAPARAVRSKGDVEAAIADAAQTITADYYLPHFSHAQMEPPAAVATFQDGKLECWTSSQHPEQARQSLAAALDMPYEDIRVNNLLLGGGFGRKSKPDYVIEAALLARAVGAPVKVVWMREDDIKHDYLHSVSAQRLEGSLDANGNLVAWRHRMASPSIGSTFDPRVDEASAGEMGLGFIDNPIAVPNMQLEVGKAPGKARIGWLRSVNNVQHAFAVQSFIAELAHAAGRDPKDFLLDAIGEDRVLDLAQEGLIDEYGNYGQPYEEHPISTKRLKDVINIAAERIGWDGSVQGNGRGFGIAGHRSFNSYVAAAVEVNVDDRGNLDITRAVLACDCGIAVNPESVRAQMEGGALYGLSNMLESAVTFTNGRVNQNNFYDYRPLRMSQAPREIDVHIVESNAAPGGAGEPGTPPFPPAVANAIFQATGKRIRTLPLGNQLA